MCFRKKGEQQGGGTREEKSEFRELSQWAHSEAGGCGSPLRAHIPLYPGACSHEPSRFLNSSLDATDDFAFLKDYCFLFGLVVGFFFFFYLEKGFEFSGLKNIPISSQAQGHSPSLPPSPPCPSRAPWRSRHTSPNSRFSFVFGNNAKTPQKTALLVRKRESEQGEGAFVREFYVVFPMC